MVTPGLNAPDGVLGEEEQPGQGLIDTQQEGTPRPGERRPAEPPEMGILQQVRPVIPGCDEPIGQTGEERDKRQQTEGAGDPDPVPAIPAPDTTPDRDPRRTDTEDLVIPVPAER